MRFPRLSARRSLRWLALTFSAFCLSTPQLTFAQDEAAPAYKVVPGFFKLPTGWSMGAAAGLDLDARGNIFVFNRGEHPIIEFDSSGEFKRSFGEAMFSSAHGLRLDPQGNIWVTDNANHTVTKFTPDGKVALTLGKKDNPGEDRERFNKPSDIAFASNGDVYVTDGYGNSRVVKFNREGKFLLAWGKPGKGEGEFNLPHAVRLDKDGNVYVADRENDRIQVFDANGKYIRQMTGFAPFGLYITPDERLFVADGRAHRVLILSLEGKQLGSFGKPGPEPGALLLPHAVAVGKSGEVYVGEITSARAQKFAPTKR